MARSAATHRIANMLNARKRQARLVAERAENPDRDEVAPGESRTPEELLARAVLAQAVEDSTRRDANAAERDDARTFLAGESECFRFWCWVANCRPFAVAACAQRLLANKEEPRRFRSTRA